MHAIEARIEELTVRERHVQIGMGFIAEWDDRMTAAQWLTVILRQAGLAAPHTSLPQDDTIKFDPARWLKQMVRLHAVTRAILESHLRQHQPKVIGHIESEEGRKPKYLPHMLGTDSKCVLCGEFWGGESPADSSCMKRPVVDLPENPFRSGYMRVTDVPKDNP